MIILKTEDIKTKKFEKHIEVLDKIARCFGYEVKYQNGVICVCQVDYDFYNTSITVLHKWDDECNDVYYRFAVEFSGFGAQEDADREEKIFKSLSNAKTCVESLNFYLKEMENDYGENR